MTTESKHWRTVFAIIWGGQAVSLLGSAAVQFAMIWWLTEQTGSASVLAMAGLAGFLPQALVGPFAGVWVDRLSRKRVMIAADLFIAAASGALALTFLVGTPAPWAVYLVLFLRAAGTVFHGPAMQAAMPLSLLGLGASLAASGLLPSTAMAGFVALSALMGFTGTLGSPSYIALVQATVPPESLGRVFSLSSSMASLATPIGLFVAGPVAEAVGIATWFLVAGVLIGITGVWTYARSRRLPA